MEKRDFITLRDWSAEELEAMLALAGGIKENPAAYGETLHHKALAMVFEKPSLRTRVSFDVGIQQLGGFSLSLNRDEIHLGRRETVSDVARNLERMVQGIMVRTYSHSIVEELAAASAVPVINGLTDFCHPCQAMADYMTVKEMRGGIRGVRIGYIGDGNNVAHSLIYGAARFGARLCIACPEGYEPSADVVGWAREHAENAEGGIDIVHDPLKAAEDADVIYTDVWTSMGSESEAAERKNVFAPFQVNDSVVRCAKPDYIFMHCLPAHRGEEVSASVIDSSHSVVFHQAENRLHAQKAVMVTLMK